MERDGVNLKIIRGLFFLFLFFIQSIAFAEVKEIIAEGTYSMGDAETPTVAESRALLNAKRNAIEQAGTYIESYSKVKNFQLTHDELHLLSSGVIEIIVLEKKRTIIGDSVKFWVKIRARVSTGEIEEVVKRIKEKSSAVNYKEDLKQLQANYEKLTRDIEILKSQLKAAESEKEKQQLEAKITDSERLFQANEWFEKGQRQTLDKKYDDALKSYTLSISLDPNLAMAYFNRGHVYGEKGSYDRAIEDYSKAISLDPNLALTYNNRGVGYGEKGLYDRAMEDFNMAISLDPNCALAYFNRGTVYRNKGLYDRAMEDYSKAISSDTNFGKAYNNRGHILLKKGQYDKALEDFNKAIALDPNLALPYLNRAVAYGHKGLYDRALEDSNKAIDLDSKDAAAYCNRGTAYLQMGQYDRAIQDFNKAISLDPNLTMAYKNRQIAIDRAIRPRGCILP